MMRTHLFAVTLAGLWIMPAHATPGTEPWRPVARQCADEINQEAHCNSCSGLWWKWAMCAAKRYYGPGLDLAKLEHGVAEVEASRKAKHMYGNMGDPVRDVFVYLGYRD